MILPSHDGSCMPIERWLAFTAIIRDARYGGEFTIYEVRREWIAAVRSYRISMLNGHVAA